MALTAMTAEVYESTDPAGPALGMCLCEVYEHHAGQSLVPEKSACVVGNAHKM